MSPYRRAWIAWAVLVVAGFVIIEGLALASGDMDNTLTAHLRLILGLEPGKPWGIAGGIVFLGTLIWAAWHILIQRGKK